MIQQVLLKMAWYIECLTSTYVAELSQKDKMPHPDQTTNKSI